MGIQLESGTGNGYRSKIDQQNRLAVRSTTSPEDYHINKDNGKVWSIPFSALNPAGDDDYVVYIKNTGDLDLHITDIRLSASAATQVQINSVTGTASGGTAITPVARNLGSSETPTATIESGTDITGLTSAGTIFYMNCAVADTLYHIRTSSNIIIPKGKAVGILVETGTANLTGVISVFEGEQI